MSVVIAILFLLFFCLRLVTLALSINNEKRLKQAGAREYGRLNSRILALLHVVFYLGALCGLIPQPASASRSTSWPWPRCFV